MNQALNAHMNNKNEKTKQNRVFRGWEDTGVLNSGLCTCPTYLLHACSTPLDT
jgi:hypothetical protein